MDINLVLIHLIIFKNSKNVHFCRSILFVMSRHKLKISEKFFAFDLLSNHVQSLLLWKMYERKNWLDVA